jgi:hypothetical protein
MLRAYAPGDMLETMMACQCIMMQFVAAAAMRDASNPRQEPATLAKARAGAITASRALHQWVTKFENQRKRNELRAAQLAKAELAKAELAKAGAAKVAAAKVETGAKPGPQTPPDVPEPQSSIVTTVPAPVRNGQITDSDAVTNQLLAAAAEMRAASHVSGSARPGS